MAARLKPISRNVGGSMTMQVFAYHISGNPADILFPCLPSTAQLKAVVRIWCSSLLQQAAEFLLSCITAMQETQNSLQLDRTVKCRC